MTGAGPGDAFSGLNIHFFAYMLTAVSFRPLFAMMIAFAMLFAPFAMRSGSAMAMAPTDHQAQMMERGHCGDQPVKDQGGKSGNKSCCIAMCTAIAVAPASAVEPRVFANVAERPALTPFHQGFLAELPTPPPRGA